MPKEARRQSRASFGIQVHLSFNNEAPSGPLVPEHLNRTTAWVGVGAGLGRGVPVAISVAEVSSSLVTRAAEA